MVNLIKHTLNNQGKIRHMFLSPVLLQSKTLPTFIQGEIRIYIYEDLIEEIHNLHPNYIKFEMEEDPAFDPSPQTRIKHD